MEKTSPTPHHSNMWDTFEHILLFVNMYILATSIALILHVFVDKWFPGISSNRYSTQYMMNSFQFTLLRGYVSGMLVSYPLFSYFFLDIVKRTLHKPEIRHLKSRRILIYTTLILTFIIMIANIIAIIFNFLNGNITLNFVLHFLVTAGISSIIFIYYFNQVKEDRQLYA